MSRFEEITREMAELYKRKNMDYGNSFSQLYDKFGLQSAVIRLYDKLLRIETLMTKESQIVDESLIDTLTDLANYAIMARMELEKKDETNKEAQAITQ